ncbi:hypothetical protein C8J98_104288 [Luteibacter sp. OK325]|uniref:hypothetical protein n=1 Tax=Luteibacter sp. OK325 TaxID=2135670 RepID=UPI000D345F41|nr:hypothetical protein [Luteibacter sp. OK325]PTR33073.1 hypothetical protein C8J98_104288 [Luteibacter sp. OK325]
MPLIDGNDLAGQMLAHGIGAICIDTSTYEKNAFAFDKSLLAQCPGIRESGLRLLMVDVVEREVRAHLPSKTEDDYFSSLPPFAAISKKKSEFPDALTLLALEAFGDEMQRCILVVSEDKDISPRASSRWVRLQGHSNH